jgi:ketosteroid isomerase-like protein
MLAPDIELTATGRSQTQVSSSGGERLSEAGAGDAIVAVIRQTARGIASGAETTNRIVTVSQIRDGKATRVDAYRNKREALEAVGLGE